MFRNITEQLKFITMLFLVMIGLWMLITPLYDIVKEIFQPTPIVSMFIGAIIVLIGLREWNIKLW